MNSIKVKNLTKKFKNLTAVDNISFKVKKGTIFAFLGPNGAGKSTTIKMLTTLLRPTKGEVYLNSFNVLKEQDKARESFGVVFQDPSLDDELTAYENMNFHAILFNVSRIERKKRIKGLLKMVNLWERKDTFVKTFSGGMKRRLEIARGLIHHPKILFLDEPTLGLDPQTRNKIWDYIKNLNKKYQTTIFFTTHYMEEAEKMAQEIAIIDRGKIIIRGDLEEIKNKAQAQSLEEAFISLTGKSIREKEANSLDRMRQFKRKRNRRK
jgi:ABC-2 type transport system ATP-binding protein